MGKYKKYKILIVDDDPDLREVLLTGLDAKGYLVTVAESAEDAAMVITDKPDLILLDVLLPKMNGFEFCKKLKETKVGKQIPVIIMTGIYKQHWQEKEAKLKYGAADYLVKPFTLEKLEQLITIHLGLAERKEITEEGLGYKSKGNIKQVPIEKLLKNIGSTGKTGMLQISKGKMVRRIYFNKGNLVFVQSNIRGDSFSQLLVERKKVTEEQREEIDSFSKQKRLPKEKVAIQKGIIREDEVQFLLEVMIKNMIFRLLKLKEADYILKLRKKPPENAFKVNLDTRKILIQGILDYVL